MNGTLLTIVYLLIGWLVVRIIHKTEPVPGIFIGLSAVVCWPLVIILWLKFIHGWDLDSEEMINFIFGKRNK